MPRGTSACLLLLALMLPKWVMAASQADVPIVQLTAQRGWFIDRDNCFGGLLLRELQRQAVLIAARDELGLGTRDMVLREPFAPHGADGITTVLFESRVWRNEQARMCLSRFDGPQPGDGYLLADRKVDDAQNAAVSWVSFKMPRGPIPDYADFAVSCEAASRGSYLQALQGENVLGAYPPRPVAWVSDATAAPADPAALGWLANLDVFSQYLAVRQLHQQIRTDGASPDRLTALVRGYANLGMLTHDQWSRANKVFLARALLYAQRLVVHENASPASLFARAYARACAGLHAAALADLETAAKMETNAVPPSAPSWVPLVKAMCRFDPYPLEDAIVAGNWHDQQLAVFLAIRVATDKFPVDQLQIAVRRALTNYPGMFERVPGSLVGGEPGTPRSLDTLINQVPVVVNAVLGSVPFSASSIGYAVRHLTTGDDSFKQLAIIRDKLNAAALKSRAEVSEPSLAVLADLIEQQEMIAIVQRAVASKNTGAGTADIQKLASNAILILKVHPWGAYVDVLGMDPNGPEKQLTKFLARIKDRDPGPWVDEALGRIDALPGIAGDPTKSLREGARQTADALVGEYTGGGDQAYLWRLCKTSPHSATLMAAWLASMPADRIAQETSLYRATIERVETEFSDRPAVVQAASDWCNIRGDFDRSLKMLSKIDGIEPSFESSMRLSRLDRHLGKKDDSLAQLLQAVQLTSDPGETATAYQQAAVDLIEDHRCDEALACVQSSADAPTGRIWQLMARCYEAMNQLESADECLRQQAVADPPSIAQHYLWASRLKRADARDIGRRAALVFNQPTEFMPAFFMAMADNQEHKALQILRQDRGSMADAFSLAQMAILAKKQSDVASLTDALDAMPIAVFNGSFGSAFKSLARSKDVSAGITEFDSWVNRQLYDEDAVDWYSLAGRYLLAGGHDAEAKVYLLRAVGLAAHEREDYCLAWSELMKMGVNPGKPKS